MKIQETDFAREFAVRAHGSQMYGDHPYARHLEEVAGIAQHFDAEDTVDAMAAHRARLITLSYLHDVLEDTSVDEHSLRAIFGDHITQVVAVISDPRGEARHVRKAKVNKRLSRIDEATPLSDALIVKAADRLANVKSAMGLPNDRLFRMYTGEYPEFRKAAYREGLCDPIWEQLDALISVRAFISQDCRTKK